MEWAHEKRIKLCISLYRGLNICGQRKKIRAGVCRVDFEEEEGKERKGTKGKVVTRYFMWRWKLIGVYGRENTITWNRICAPSNEASGFEMERARYKGKYIDAEKKKKTTNALRIKYKRRARIKFKNVIVSPSWNILSGVLWIVECCLLKFFCYSSFIIFELYCIFILLLVLLLSLLMLRKFRTCFT